MSHRGSSRPGNTESMVEEGLVAAAELAPEEEVGEVQEAQVAACTHASATFSIAQHGCCPVTCNSPRAESRSTRTAQMQRTGRQHHSAARVRQVTQPTAHLWSCRSTSVTPYRAPRSGHCHIFYWRDQALAARQTGRQSEMLVLPQRSADTSQTTPGKVPPWPSVRSHPMGLRSASG